MGLDFKTVKMKFGKPSTLVVLFLVGAVLVMTTSFFVLDGYTTDTATPSLEQIDKKHIKYHVEGQPVLSSDFWAKKVDALGMEKAHAFLASTIDHMNDYGKHLNAHQFGDALYWEKSLRGVLVCDDRFGRGCFHQFFMTALDQEGDSVVPQLEEVCLKEFGKGTEGHSCNHGIGHGIMAALDEDLSKALNICRSFESQELIFACIDGVFMEYFTPTTLVSGEDTKDMKPVDQEDPSAVCRSVQEMFKPTCYSMQSSWWLSYGINTEKAGAWCENIAHTEHKKACFKGLGYALVLSSDYQKDIVIQACNSASRTQEQKILCRAGAFWGFKKGEEVGEELTEEDKALCQLEQRKRCLEEADLVGTGVGISAICCAPRESL